MSGYLGQALFGENLKVRIFWSPDFKQTTVIHCDTYSFCSKIITKIQSKKLAQKFPRDF